MIRRLSASGGTLRRRLTHRTRRRTGRAPRARGSIFRHGLSRDPACGSACDDFVEPFDNPNELLGREPTEPAAQTLDRQRAHLADLDPCRFPEPLLGELKREGEARALRLTGD